MNISIRLSEVDVRLIKTFADYNSETVSDFLKRVAFDEIHGKYSDLLGQPNPKQGIS